MRIYSEWDTQKQMGKIIWHLFLLQKCSISWLIDIAIAPDVCSWYNCWGPEIPQHASFYFQHQQQNITTFLLLRSVLDTQKNLSCVEAKKGLNPFSHRVTMCGITEKKALLSTQGFTWKPKSGNRWQSCISHQVPLPSTPRPFVCSHQNRVLP